MKKPIQWPTGSITTKDTWHFHKNLFERYHKRLLPDEYDQIKMSILQNELKPLVLTKTAGKRLQIYCYHRSKFHNRDPIFILAHPETGRLISVYKPSWIKRDLNQERISKKRYS